MEDKPVCGICDAPLVFRRWSSRLPAKSEALARCPGGCGMWQVRYFGDRRTSDPYQVRAGAKKGERGSWRLSRERRDAIVSAWGSVQEFLDYAPIVVLPCMTRQYKS